MVSEARDLITESAGALVAFASASAVASLEMVERQVQPYVRRMEAGLAGADLHPKAAGFASDVAFARKRCERLLYLAAQCNSDHEALKIWAQQKIERCRTAEAWLEVLADAYPRNVVEWGRVALVLQNIGALIADSPA